MSKKRTEKKPEQSVSRRLLGVADNLDVVGELLEVARMATADADNRKEANAMARLLDIIAERLAAERAALQAIRLGA